MPTFRGAAARASGVIGGSTRAAATRRRQVGVGGEEVPGVDAVAAGIVAHHQADGGEPGQRLVHGGLRELHVGRGLLDRDGDVREEAALTLYPVEHAALGGGQVQRVKRRGDELLLGVERGGCCGHQLVSPAARRIGVATVSAAFPVLDRAALASAVLARAFSSGATLGGASRLQAVTWVLPAPSQYRRGVNW